MGRGLVLLRRKITLINAYLSSIPLYYLSLFRIPVGVAERIKRYMKRFLLAGVGKDHRDHLVSWEVYCRSKDLGGLDIGNLKPKCTSFGLIALRIPVGT